MFLTLIKVPGLLSRKIFFTLEIVQIKMRLKKLHEGVGKLNLICISWQNQIRIKKYEDVCATQLIFIRHRRTESKERREGKRNATPTI